MDELRRVWAVAGRPDSNLGQGEVGPSPQHVTLTPVLRVLDAMQIDGDSVFVDIGSGHGLVTFAAALYSGARISYGIEMRKYLYEFSVERARELFEEDPTQWPIRLLHADVTTVAHPFDWTHSYSFDKDFPPEVLAHVASLFRASTSWRVFASSLPEKRWQEAAGARWWHESVRLRARHPVRIAGSGEQHSIYVYERIDAVPRRRSARLAAATAAISDERALVRSRYEAHLQPAFFGSEAQPNRWLPGAVTRVLIRSGSHDAFDCALPGSSDELDPDRARMLASRGFYFEDPQFSRRPEIEDYRQNRVRKASAVVELVSDDAELASHSIETSIADFSREVKSEPAEEDLERAVEAEREQEVVREKRSLDSYHRLVAQVGRYMSGARFLAGPTVSVVARLDYLEELRTRPRPSDDLPDTILSAPGQATRGLLATLARDALRVSAERALIAQMEESDLLVRPVPPHRVRDLASMPGFSASMHPWMTLIYALFAFSCASDIALLSYSPMPAERYAAVTAVARLVNYVRDARFEALESTEPADTTEPQRAALAADLGVLALRPQATAADFIRGPLPALLRDIRPFAFALEDAAVMSFAEILRTATAAYGNVPSSLWIELKAGVRPAIDANSVYRIEWESGGSGFGYSVRSFILAEQPQKRGQRAFDIVLARDEALQWHLFDCNGRRQGVCMPFAVPLGPRNPVRPGDIRVDDPLEEMRSWVYSYEKSTGSVFVLLERDMDALAGLHEEYPPPAPDTPVSENAQFGRALVNDLELRRNPPSSALATRDDYRETRLDQVGLAGGPPAFDLALSALSPPMRYEGSQRAMAVALALFHMNDSLDVPLLLRYPIQEPIVDPNRADAAMQLATDRLIGLVVAPMRMRGWERIRKSRLAVARHYLTDHPSMLFADSFRFLRWFYDLGGYDEFTQNIVEAVRDGLDNRPWWLKRATAAAWAAIKTALAAGVVAGIGTAAVSAYSAPVQAVQTATVVGGAAFHFGLKAALTVGSAAIETAANHPRISLTAAALVAGARPVESLAYLFGLSVRRVAASTTNVLDRTRFAFKIYFSDTVSLRRFAEAVPARADDALAADDDQLRALLSTVRTGLAPGNLAYEAVAVEEQRKFPRALLLFTGADRRVPTLLADSSPETWLEAAGHRGDLPAFSIAAFFNLSDKTIERDVALAGHIPLRLQSARGTYDLASFVWRSGADYFVIERNKQGTYWCMQVRPGVIEPLGTISRSNLLDAMSVASAPLLVHRSGRKSLWPSEVPGENSIWKRCTFVLYNNSLLYPNIVVSGD